MPRLRFLASLLAALPLSNCAHESAAPLDVLGVWHRVTEGDTADSIASRYGADADTIAELNDLPRDGEIQGRDEVFVPKAGGKPPGTGAMPPAAVRGDAGDSTKARETVGGTCGVDGRPCFAWPVEGKLASRFGPEKGKHHDGLDILAARGSAVRAAYRGKVIYAGDEIKGYGNLVLLRHDGDLITVYAHNDKNTVKEGDEVAEGDKIAEVGSTGSATAPHLHFEVRLSQQPRDPLLYLPSKENR